MNDDSCLPILALNAGSSSLKFGVYLVGMHTSRRLVSGEAETVAAGHVAFVANDADGKRLVTDTELLSSPFEAIDRIAELLVEERLPTIAAVGHRIVHGGPLCRHHTVIDATVLQHLNDAKTFAPLHVPPALSLLEFAQKQFPDAQQVACLDTAFHTTMPDVARTLPIPKEFRALGIERYGFHGLSCESIVRQFGADVPKRLIIAHLGHGASVTAVSNGMSIDTSMGLTPSGGVIMSTRCGDIDPGVLAFFVREQGYSAEQFEDLIDHRSGMIGISGVSGDMRKLRSAATSNLDAALAIEMFCYSIRKQVAAMAAVLGGVDALVFTGGIGENDAATRTIICEGLQGLHIIAEPACVRVMPAQEDEQIALHTWHLTH
ncbi:MAG: acetate/propionate family kinase [Casimicrobium sp.]